MATKKTEDTNPVDYTQLNVLQKLQMARLDFLNAGVKKTGKNIHLEFKYFELEDIVPMATAIFAKIGLLAVPTFGKEYGIMRVYNVDDRDEEPVIFETPFTVIQPIVSNTGKVVTNEMQALGSSITYMRRYLWQLALDIIESDNIDATLGDGAEEDAPKPKKNKPPATVAERKKAKEELTDPAATADELQITALKAALKNLLEIDSEQESFVQEIVVRTDSFTNISKEACEQLIVNLGEMIAAYNVTEEAANGN